VIEDVPSIRHSPGHTVGDGRRWTRRPARWWQVAPANGGLVAHVTALTAALVLCTGAAAADESAAAGAAPVLASWGDVEVTTRDLRAYTLGLPDDTRKQVMSSKDKLGRAVRNLLLRKTLMREALERDIDNTEAAQLRLHQARQDILITEWRRVYLDEHSVADPESLAREEYLANRDQYRRPERRDVTHILIPTRQRPEQEAREIIEAVKAQIETGELSFDQAVAEYSEGPAAENNNGRINSITPGQTAQAFDEAAFSLDAPGDWTGPVQTRFGFHLIRLDDIHPAKQQPFEAVRDEVIAMVRKRYRDKLWQNHLDQLSREAGQPEIDAEAIAQVVDGGHDSGGETAAPSSNNE